MISNLIHKPYTIETMNALEIKKTLIKQYHLTKLNIVGFYTSCNHHCNFLDNKEKYPVVCDLAPGEFKERDAYFTKDYKGEFDLRDCLLNPLYYSLEESTEEVRRRYERGGYTKKITGVFAKDKNEGKGYSGLYGDWYAVKYLTEEEAVEEFLKIMEKYIDSYQYRISDEVLKYQFDFSPVIVNKNDENIELIDGFKRLLLVADDQLDFDIPVVVYHDLNDEDYLTILFAANEWKMRADWGENFYDRGFLFSLANRFKFDIHKPLPYKFSITKILSWYCGISNKRTYSYHGEESKASFLYKNPKFVEDISKIVDLLDKDYLEDRDFILQEYDFGKVLFETFIETVGRYRLRGNFEELDLKKILDDYLERHEKVISKKINMGVDGHIRNHFSTPENRDFNFKI